MAIYRGPGGSGDAVNDSLSETRLAVEARDAAIAAKVAAEAARDAAEAASINPASIAITGGSINGTTVGATTPSTGAFTSLSASGAFSANGGATLGDASGDALTINSSAVSIPNGLNFDSNTFVIDATNNRVGVGTASPATNLHILSSSASGTIETIEATTTNTRAFTYYKSFDASNTALTAVVGNFGDENRFDVRVETAHPILFGTSNTERMRITSAGNVGIGTSSPAFKLDVVGGAIQAPSVAFGATGGYYFNSGANAGARRWLISNDVNTFGDFVISTSTTQTGTPSTQRLVINSSGDVGIGTASPARKLDVAGAIRLADANRLEWATGEYYIVGDTGGAMLFGANSAERMRIDSSGNVGIGTSSPAVRLDMSNSNGGVASTLRIGSGTNDMGTIQFFNTVASTVNSTITGNLEGSNSGGDLRFSTKATAGSLTERMRLDSSGNLGIGTSSPTQLFDMYQNGAAISKIRGGTATNQGAGYYVWKADNSGALCAFGDSANQFGGTPDAIVGIYTNVSIPLVFNVSNAERMRIHSSGGVSIGNTTDRGAASLNVSGVVLTGGYTVATLPAGVVGMRAYVTDALAPSFGVTVAGSGAVTIPVFYNGANWIVA